MEVYALRIGRGPANKSCSLGWVCISKFYLWGAHPNPKPVGSLDQSARDFFTMKLWNSPGQRRGAQLVLNKNDLKCHESATKRPQISISVSTNSYKEYFMKLKIRKFPQHSHKFQYLWPCRGFNECLRTDLPCLIEINLKSILSLLPNFSKKIQ